MSKLRFPGHFGPHQVPPSRSDGREYFHDMLDELKPIVTQLGIRETARHTGLSAMMVSRMMQPGHNTAAKDFFQLVYGLGYRVDLSNYE